MVLATKTSKLIRDIDAINDELDELLVESGKLSINKTEDRPKIEIIRKKLIKLENKVLKL